MKAEALFEYAGGYLLFHQQGPRHHYTVQQVRILRTLPRGDPGGGLKQAAVRILISPALMGVEKMVPRMD